MTRLIEVEDLNVHFPVKKGILSRTVGKVQAVDRVSIHLDKGETLGLVGESGCGKTTLGLAILRLIEPTAGRVLYMGRDLGRTSREQRRPIRKEMQIIFQDPNSSLNPRMTVYQALSGPMGIHGLYPGRQRRERVEYLLEKVGLTPEQAQRYPHEFSGGQKQRIGIARALSVDPKIIIGDEPVSALDVSIQAQIINLLIDLQRDFNLSYIMIAHDLAVIEYMSDRIAVMYLGRIVETAAYHDLYHNPLHPYTQALLSAIPQPDPTRARRRTILKGDVPSPIDPPSGCRFHTRCPERMDVCDKVEPQLEEHRPGHRVSCHLY
jgi:oligopeptide/dipeptide ABC transporter ATP-binding protein